MKANTTTCFVYAQLADGTTTQLERFQYPAQALAYMSKVAKRGYVGFIFRHKVCKLWAEYENYDVRFANLNVA